MSLGLCTVTKRTRTGIERVGEVADLGEHVRVEHHFVAAPDGGILLPWCWCSGGVLCPLSMLTTVKRGAVGSERGGAHRGGRCSVSQR